MFCPSCGTETTTGLKYCNRCGANLGSLSAPTEIVQVNLTKPALIIGLIVMFLTLGGFGLLIGGARSLAGLARGDDPLIALIFVGMATILTIDILLIRQLSKLISAALRSDAPKNTLPQANVQQLPRPTAAPFIPASSVTENTTRFLESDYRAPVEPRPGEKHNS
jgi:hypothetical protein